MVKLKTVASYCLLWLVLDVIISYVDMCTLLQYVHGIRFVRVVWCLFQYCDVNVPEIQEMLEKLPAPAPGAKCHERLGWMPSGMDDRCREIISKLVTEVLKQEKVPIPCMLSNIATALIQCKVQNSDIWIQLKFWQHNHKHLSFSQSTCFNYK